MIHIDGSHIWVYTNTVNVDIELGWQSIHQQLHRWVYGSTHDIGNGAFSRCSNLSEVALNKGLQKIGTSAFSTCISLQSISIVYRYQCINCPAFVDCTNLRQVVSDVGLPANIGWAFLGCAALESYEFPSISARLKGISPRLAKRKWITRLMRLVVL